MAYRLAIFDFDGTLADTFPWFLRVVNEAADVFGFRRVEGAEAEALRRYHAREIGEHLRIPAWKLPVVASWMRRRMARDIGTIALFPGAGALLQRLSAEGVTLAIVSSNSAANIRRVLGADNAGLIRYYGCGASMFGKRAKLRKVLRESGVAPAEALCIGDELRDLQAARAEGIPFGAVAWGYTEIEALAAHQPEETFACVADVFDGVTRLRARAPAA
jgi:phosphoglycolate phosphatase